MELQYRWIYSPNVVLIITMPCFVGPILRAWQDMSSHLPVFNDYEEGEEEQDKEGIWDINPPENEVK